MSGLSIYLLSILGMVILSVVIDLVMPEGQISKYIKGIFSVFLVFVIISPVINFVKGGIDVSQIFGSADSMVDQEYLESMRSQQVKYMEKQIEGTLNTAGFAGVEVDIQADISEKDIKINSIFVDLTNLVLAENLEHINKYTAIKELIKRQVKIEEDKIILDG